MKQKKKMCVFLHSESRLSRMKEVSKCSLHHSASPDKHPASSPSATVSFRAAARPQLLPPEAGRGAVGAADADKRTALCL